MHDSDDPALISDMASEPDMPMNALGLDEPPQPRTAAAQVYRVLARKYRPQTFAELIGQDAMVQTLANAIRRERLAHAFLMTGVRGVGKTSTARLIAKAWNCIGPDGRGGPTIDPCGRCEPCVAIAEGRHIDVVEMDAASHTGIDDVREIIEASRYAAVSARYKIYIIDEVHMLSKAAFNGLLKTLEEPPAHVKFLFATTEVNKIPITVLSRCQRFDLKRIPSERLAAHFAEICEREGVGAEEDALAMIADAAEGSVRDGLSILDQAIAHADLEGADLEGADGAGAPQVRADQVRDMLGLSDRSAVRRILAHILAGESEAMLAALDEQHMLGVDPIALVRGLMTLVHGVTLAKAAPRARVSHSEADRAAIADWAGRLGQATLHRLWQLLLKGHDEIAAAPVPREACEMALLRLVYAAGLPDPGSLARRLAEAPAAPPASAEPVLAEPASAPAEQAPDAHQAAVQAAPAMSDSGFADLAAIVATLEDAGHRRLAIMVEADLALIALDGQTIRYRSHSGRDGYIAELREALRGITGKAWQIEPGEGPAALPLAERARAAAADARAARLAHPLVQATLAAFPGAEEIIDEDADRAGGAGLSSNRSASV